MKLTSIYSRGIDRGAKIRVELEQGDRGCGELLQGYFEIRDYSLEELNLSELKSLKKTLEEYIPPSVAFIEEVERCKQLVDKFIHKLKLSQDPIYRLECELRIKTEEAKKLESSVDGLRSLLGKTEKKEEDLRKKVYDFERILMQAFDLNENGGPGSRKKVRELIEGSVDLERVRNEHEPEE